MTELKIISKTIIIIIQIRNTCLRKKKNFRQGNIECSRKEKKSNCGGTEKDANFRN